MKVVCPGYMVSVNLYTASCYRKYTHSGVLQLSSEVDARVIQICENGN